MGVLTRIVIAMALVLSVAGCKAGSATQRISLVNDSGTTLSQIVLSGSGFSQSAGSLDPGQRSSVAVRPSGESGLAVSFVADGRSHESTEQGYFEQGASYKVEVTVHQDLSVTVQSGL